MPRPKKTEEEVKRISEIILKRIEEGMSLRKATANNEPCSMSTFMDMVNADKQLAEQYAHAREVRSDKIFEEILEIADDSTNDTMVIYDNSGNPKEVENKEWVNRSRLRIDARKWMLGKMQPKKYGDKLDVTSEGKAINQMPPVTVKYESE